MASTASSLPGPTGCIQLTELTERGHESGKTMTLSPWPTSASCISLAMRARSCAAAA